MPKITVSVKDKDLVFNVDDDDLNRLINEQDPTNKVGSTYNMLSRTVADESRDDFKRLCLTDENIPRGIVVMQIGGVVMQEMGGDIKVTIKKPKTTQPA